MKKEALISALLTMSPSMQLQAGDLQAAMQEVRSEKQNLLGMQFVSKQTGVDEFFVDLPGDDYEIKEQEYFVTLSFMEPDNWYYYDGFGGMEYEVIVEFKSTLTGEPLENWDRHYYAKRLDENTFKLFDCDSSKKCSDSTYNIEFHIFDTPNGKLLKFKRSSEVDEMKIDFSKEYYQVK
jgi:hypothetical protein